MMRTTQCVTVSLERAPQRTYNVFIEAGMLDRVAERVRATWHGRRVFIITDTHVERLFGRHVLGTFVHEGVEAKMTSFAAGEQSKTAATVQRLFSFLLRHGIDRRSLIVALGGGVVGDVAGFVAATILRGVPYVHIPTTLLAQVDSSVGGKVGINHRLGKNLIGAFHQPVAVFVDPNTLETLPRAEYRNGLAEIVKIAATRDATLFAHLERHPTAIAQAKLSVLVDVIARAIALKASIVERDEREAHLRKTLNVGHTIGHAIEAASGYTIRHGEALAMGLAAETHLAVAMGVLVPAVRARIVRLLRAFGLPVRFPVIKQRARFLSALAADKKAEGGTPTFVLLEDIGKVMIGAKVPSVFIQQLLADGVPLR
ncbi:MAG: 3-dehydroquinate synthase [Ignavibacteria bacterium]